MRKESVKMIESEKIFKHYGIQSREKKRGDIYIICSAEKDSASADCYLSPFLIIPW